MTNRQERLFVLIRLLISGTILAVLFTRFWDQAYGHMLEALSASGLLFLGLAVLLHYVEKLWKIAVFKRVLLSHKVVVRYVKLVTITFVSVFLGFFFPTTYAPDLIRAIKLRGHGPGFVQPVSATLILNLSTLLSLAALTACGTVLASARGLPMGAEFIWTAGIVSASIIVLFAVAIHPRSTALAARIFSSPVARRLRIDGLSATFLSHMNWRTLKDDRGGSFVLMALVLLVNCVKTYFIARCVGIDIPFSYFMIFVPGVVLLAGLPISFAGIGVRESAFAFFLAEAGVSGSQAFLVGLIVSLLHISLAAVGGVIYVVQLMGARSAAVPAGIRAGQARSQGDRV
jgi:hypothetical protein